MSLQIIITLLITILLWLYFRSSFKRNLTKVLHLRKDSVYIFDFIFLYIMSWRFTYRIQNSITVSKFFTVMINISYILMGLLGLFLLMFIFFDLKELIHKIIDKRKTKKEHPVDLSRREFFTKNALIAGLAGSTVITGIGYFQSFNPEIKKVIIPLADKFKKLSGLKVVQLSDVHIGPTLTREFCQDVVNKCNSLNPDIVVLTGDLIDGEVDYLKYDLEPLLKLKNKFGVFFITGNHEYYWNGKNWIDWAKNSGMITLVNENYSFKYNDHDVHIIGVSDLQAERFDPVNYCNPKKAVEGVPDDAFKLLLAHQPKTCFLAENLNIHTQLSGHTHGGQGFPWSIIVSLVQPYFKGLYNHKGMNLYVHSGTGFWGPPNRFMNKSEIAEIVFEYKV